MSGAAGFLRLGSLSLAIRLCGVGLGLAVSVILARVLESDGYGEYAFAFALVTLVAVPAQLGLPNLVIRETARARKAGQPEQAVALWRWSLRTVAAMSTAGIALLLIGYAALKPPGLGFMTVLWAAPLLPLITLTNVRGAALRGLGLVNLGQLPDLVLRPAVLLAGLLVVLTLGLQHGMTPATALQLHVVGAFAAVAVATWWVYRARPPKGGAAPPLATETRAAWLRSSVILGLLAGLQTVNASTDVVMLGFLREQSEVGIYRVAISLASVSIFVLVSLNAVIMPQVVEMVEAGRTEALQRLVAVTARAAFAAAFVFTAILAVFGREILSLVFGPDYVSAYSMMIILLLGHATNAFFGPVALVMNMAGMERDVVRGVAFGTVTNVVLNLLLIPIYGGVGAAIATGCSILTWNLILYLRARSRIGVDCAAVPLVRS